MPIVRLLSQLSGAILITADNGLFSMSVSTTPSSSNLSDQRIGLIDVGIGNWASLLSLMRPLGSNPVVVRRGENFQHYDRIILPGVGNFGAFSSALKASGMWEELRNGVVTGAVPMLGICVGAQILLDSSEESETEEGLGIIPGVVRQLSPDLTRTIPRIGWDYLDVSSNSGLSGGAIESLSSPNRFYFSHSYFVIPIDRAVVKATSRSSSDIPAVISHGHVVGVQFHPERSSKFGASFLGAYLRGFFDAP